MRGAMLFRSGSTSPLGNTPVYGPVLFVQRLGILVAEAEIDRQVGAHPPVILGVPVVAGSAEIHTRASEADGTGLRNSEQEIGHVEAGVGQGIAPLVECAGGEAAEAERATPVFVRPVVDLAAPVAKAKREVVRSNHPREAFTGARSLAAVQLCAAVPEAAEVGEGEVGRAEIHRVAGGALDSQFSGDVFPVSEERNGLSPVPAESEAEIVDQRGRQGVRPTHAGAQSPARGGVAEPV